MSESRKAFATNARINQSYNVQKTSKQTIAIYAATYSAVALYLLTATDNYQLKFQSNRMASREAPATNEDLSPATNEDLSLLIDLRNIIAVTEHEYEKKHGTKLSVEGRELLNYHENEVSKAIVKIDKDEISAIKAAETRAKAFAAVEKIIGGDVSAEESAGRKE